jgi:hypothetical protein
MADQSSEAYQAKYLFLSSPLRFLHVSLVASTFFNPNTNTILSLSYRNDPSCHRRPDRAELSAVERLPSH